jgi:predicted DsbA family dithiol-disulfide isomerase
VQLEITHFTDPVCPFAFCAEPVRLRLRWRYGEQLRWRNRMIVLTLEDGEAEKLAEGAPGLQRQYGMPINPFPYPRTFSSVDACRAVIAARLHSPGAEEPLLRALRALIMAGGLADDPQLIAEAARAAGLEPASLRAWCETAEVEQALAADIDAARRPSAAARALDHKLGGPAGQRRYTAPSCEIAHPDGRSPVAVPGFQSFDTYDAAIANLAPELRRRAKPASVQELLAWADAPLASSEVSAIAELEPAAARAQCARVGRPIAAGADFYWTLESE